jgi:hypothetical protein
MKYRVNSENILKNVIEILEVKPYEIKKIDYEVDIYEIRNINQEVKYNKNNNEKESKKHGWVYLLREKENIEKNENIYKIGKTITNIKRLYALNYKEAHIYRFTCVRNSDICEKKLIIKFKEKFGNPIKGHEYFKGDERDIQILFDEIINEEFKNNNTL